MKMAELQKRWAHPERTGIVTDHIGHADISSWSKATTHFKRPECQGKNLTASVKVTSLAKVGNYQVAKAKLASIPDPRNGTGIFVVETPEVKPACDFREVCRIQKDFWRHLGVPRGGDVRLKA